jgi:effector-binding domain-containing protein
MLTKPFMFREAMLPAGYPPPAPVGEVVVKSYPASRVAIVRSAEMGGADSNQMFQPLFEHITKNDISMTTPVVMDYQPGAATAATDPAQPASMAFVYADTTLGTPGVDGDVRVEDLPAITVVSIGVRGSYDDEAQFRVAIDQLRKWLADNADEYESAGVPRVLGYNSPFVPRFLRYGEVQIPIRRR